jgi:LysM repeat protein
MSTKSIFRSGKLKQHELVAFGMGPESDGLMLESAPVVPVVPEVVPVVPEVVPVVPVEPVVPVVPEVVPVVPDVLMTESAKDDAFFEAVDAKAAMDDRGMAAATLLDWASGTEHSADSLDAMAAALAGIDTDSDADITDEDVDNYNYWLGLMADAAVAMGADQVDVTSAIDDDDDDAASVMADSLSGADDSAIVQHQLMTESAMMFEATVKVVRAGKVKLLKKRPHPRRMTSKQRNALKKNARRAHTAAAELKRLKSMRKRKSAGL